MIKSSALRLELFSAFAIAERNVLSRKRAAFLGIYLRIETAYVAFFPGSIRATSRAFLGEILIYFEYDLTSIITSEYEDCGI